MYITFASIVALILLVTVICCTVFIFLRAKTKQSIASIATQNVNVGPVYEDIQPVPTLSQHNTEAQLLHKSVVSAAEIIELQKNCCYGDTRRITMTECPAYMQM